MSVAELVSCDDENHVQEEEEVQEEDREEQNGHSQEDAGTSQYSY